MEAARWGGDRSQLCKRPCLGLVVLCSTLAVLGATLSLCYLVCLIAAGRRIVTGTFVSHTMLPPPGSFSLTLFRGHIVLQTKRLERLARRCARSAAGLHAANAMRIGLPAASAFAATSMLLSASFPPNLPPRYLHTVAVRCLHVLILPPNQRWRSRRPPGCAPTHAPNIQRQAPPRDRLHPGV